MMPALLFDLDDTLMVNRDGRTAPPDRPNLVEISTLGDLQSALGD